MLEEFVMIQAKNIRQFWMGIALFFLFLFLWHLSLASSKTQEEKHWAIPIKKEINLYAIENNLFRSRQLLAKDYTLLKKLGIKSIVNLRFFNRNEDEEVFEGKGFEIINIPMITWNIKPKEVAVALWEIEKRKKRGAVLVHCYHGADRTGVVSAMYRVIYQGWTMEEGKKELMEGPYGFHSIWRNIENFFTQENEEVVRQELNSLKKGA